MEQADLINVCNCRMRGNKEHGAILFSVVSSERKKRQQTQTEIQDNLFKHFFCEDGQILNRFPGELMSLHP